MYRLGWFSTGRGAGSQGLLKAMQDAITAGKIKAKIEFVFCSREKGEAEGSDDYLKLVKNYDIPLITYSYQHFKKEKHYSGSGKKGALPDWRLEYDREVMKRLERFQPDLCVLAGYMLIVGAEMCQRYDLLNLHPAAPDGPKGTWQEVIWKLIAQSAQETGAMMHLATPDLDRGPVVSYCKFPIRGEAYNDRWTELAGKNISQVKLTQNENNPLFQLIREQGVIREQPLVVATVKAFSEVKIRISNHKVYDNAGNLLAGYDLSTEINEMVAGNSS